MTQFFVGLVLGSVLTTGLGLAQRDFLDRTPQQQKYDYFRERQQQLDIENIRKNQDAERLRNLGRTNPC
jgi:hypothetical protein